MNANETVRGDSPHSERSIANRSKEPQPEDASECSACGSEATREVGRSDEDGARVDRVCANGHTVARDVVGGEAA